MTVERCIRCGKKPYITQSGVVICETYHFPTKGAPSLAIWNQMNSVSEKTRYDNFVSSVATMPCEFRSPA